MFREGIKSEAELLQLRQGKKGSKKVARYQRKQNEVRLAKVLYTSTLMIVQLQLIDFLLKPMEIHTAEAQEQEEAARLPVKLCIQPLL